MKCFAHQDQIAIGVCTQCGKGVCATCCDGREGELWCNDQHRRLVKWRTTLTSYAAISMVSAWKARLERALIFGALATACLFLAGKADKYSEQVIFLAVILVVIAVVDLTRARALYRMAKRAA